MAIRKRKPVRNAQFDEALHDLREFVEFAQKHGRIPDGMVVRTYTRANIAPIPKPRTFSPAQVRSLRNRVGASQAVFAQLLGVSLRLVCHWEQGIREPNPLARRMLETIQRDLKPWTAMLRSSRKSGRAA